VSTAAALAATEAVIDRSGAAARVEALLPAGARSRQLRVRTLLPGMALALAGHRPAHLTRVHSALTGLPASDQVRLGVIAGWKAGPHQLTCRQVERTFGLVTRAQGKDPPGGAPVVASPPSAMTCSKPASPRAEEHHPGTRGRLERPGNLLPATVQGHQRPRRPRSVPGTPQEQPARPQRRAVLRLLRLRRSNGARGTRAARPRAGPPG